MQKQCLGNKALQWSKFCEQSDMKYSDVYTLIFVSRKAWYKDVIRIKQESIPVGCI